MTLLDTTDEFFVATSNRARVAEPALSRGWSRRTTIATVAALLAVALVFALAWPLTGTVVPWDSKNQFYAIFRFLGDSLRQGSVPLWNPYQYAGAPAIADPQSLIFTPTMLLFALVAPDASMPVFDGVVYAHLVLGALAVLGLGRRWGWHPTAALLAALVFAFGGAAAGRLQHTGMIISYAFFPPTLWALQVALDRRSLGRAVLAGLVAALMALGRDQVAYLLCLAVAGAVAREIASEGDPLRGLRRRLPVLAVAGATVVAIMIVPVLLTMQFLQDSNRPGIAYGVALEGSLDPVNLLTLFAPNVFGTLDWNHDYWGPGVATTFGDNWTDRCTNYLFAGTLPFVLMLWHGIVGGRLAERGVRTLAVVGAAALLFALGRFTPFFPAAFDWIPGVALYRRPADATFVFEIALAFASGHLLQRYIEAGLPRVGTVRLGLLIAGSALLVGSGLTLCATSGHLDAALLALGAAAAASALVIALLVWAGRPGFRHRTLVAAALVAATALQLGWRNAASPVNAEPAGNYSAFRPRPDQTAALAALRADMGPRLARGEHPRVEFIGLDGSWQNAAMVLKLESTSGYNPLRTGPYSRAVGVGESSIDPCQRVFPDTFRGYNSRLASLLGLDYLILDRPIANLPKQMPRPHASLLYAGDAIDVYRLDNPTVPRAAFVRSWRPVDGKAVIDSETLPDFEAGTEALVDKRDLARLPAIPPSVVADTDATDAATVVSASANRTVVTVDASADGLLVLHDLAYPGWEARVDGAPAPIVRADLLFRGVAVPAGHHTVEFAFHPFSLANLAAAAGGLLHGRGG